MTPAAQCHELGPLRILTVWLPLPEGWSKHTRVGTTKQGRRYLVPAAREYRAGVIAVVRPVLPRRPWFAADRHWYVSVVQYMAGRKFDDDQWIGGVRDDLCEAGLCEDDALARTSRLVTRDDGPPGVFVIATQEGWAP